MSEEVDLIVLDPEFGPIDLAKVKKLLEGSGVKRAYLSKKDGYSCVHPIEYNRVDVQEGSDTTEPKRDNPFRIISRRDLS